MLNPKYLGVADLLGAMELTPCLFESAHAFQMCGSAP